MRPLGAVTATATLLVASLLSVAPSVAEAGGRKGRRYPRSPTALIGKPAPELRARLPLSRKRVKQASWRGRAVLLFFFATWCHACRGVEPKLVALARRYRKSLHLFAVSHQRRRVLLAHVRQRKHARSLPSGGGHGGAQHADPTLLQCTGRSALRYAALSVPTTVLLDRRGVVRGAWRGANPAVVRAIARAVSKVAGARAP